MNNRKIIENDLLNYHHLFQNFENYGIDKGIIC